MITNMNSKMTTNSRLSTTEPKKMKTKTKQTTRTGAESQNGDHMEGYQWGGGGERMGGIGTVNKKHNQQEQNRQWDVKNTMGNGEAKELVCMTMEMN